MQTADEIKNAIESLPKNEYVRLRNWFSERDWEMWDNEIRKDSKTGKLDFLIKEAKHEKEKGTLRDL